MADSPQPDNTEWVVTKHSKLLNKDEVVGKYPTMDEAYDALFSLRRNHQWFTSYEVEHRKVSKE